MQNKESKLVEIRNAEKIIFVGDTHGDLEASQRVIRRYLKPKNKIVFLGDYVDRGEKSKENLDFLIEQRTKNPNQVYLLQGNHEGYRILTFSPADFWNSLSESDFQKYSSIVEKFPLIAATKDIIALHGALPDLSLNNKSFSEAVNDIKLGDENWQRITWGDFVEGTGGYLGTDSFSGRPQFGRDYFFKLMKRFRKKVLIRSHQETAPLFMFDNRCLTIFTSAAYKRERIVAIFDIRKPIMDARDLRIEHI